jgi:hypothetical protein
MSTSHNEVAHRWAHNRAGKGTSLRSDGTLLISYATPIARHFGTDTVLLSTKRYSVSTSKHQSYARSASTHLTQYFVSEVPRFELTRDWAMEEIEKQVLEAARLRAAAARAPKYGIYKLEDAEHCHETAVFLAKKFKIRKNLDKLAESLAQEVSVAEEHAKEHRKQQAKTFKLLVAKWKMNEPGVCLGYHHCQKTYIRRVGDTIETSKGITVPYPVFERYVRRYREHGEVPSEIIGYRVSSVSDKHVVIGCHDISWEEIESCIAN